MKTYTKTDVTNAIRELLRDKVEIYSVEHVEENEFALIIVISKANLTPFISPHNY